MKFIYTIIFIFILSKLSKKYKNLSFNDLNFKRLDFTNYKQIKLFIFKKNFYKLNNRNIHSFEFLNFSQNLGGKIGISLSRNSIFNWFKSNKNKIGYPWTEDLTSKRLINIIYNYDFINSSSTFEENKQLNKIIFFHIQRVIFSFKNKKIDEITSFDLIASILSYLILGKNTEKYINYINLILSKQLDYLGMHKSYNILEHAIFLNNLYELKNILLYFNKDIPNNIEENIIKMTSILNEYFHVDGSIPLFNGSNNNYTKTIYNSLNKEEYLRSREFSKSKNGIAFYSDKNKKLFFDVVQPSINQISNNMSASSLSFEFSCQGEKIISNCGASESSGKNPNISEIKELGPLLQPPQSVTFESNKIDGITVFEGSHNGYQKKFSKIVKRKLVLRDKLNKLEGEDTIISIKNISSRIIYHIRFHLVSGIVFNFTNNKKNIILRSKLNNMWLFKSDVELEVEDSIIVDNNTTIPTKQIVIKGFTNSQKLIRKWSLEKI